MPKSFKISRDKMTSVDVKSNLKLVLNKIEDARVRRPEVRIYFSNLNCIILIVAFATH